MRKVYLILYIIVFGSLFPDSAEAQQDPQYTQYMYNPLAINPAYTGSRDVLSVVGLYRSQWVGLEGAPRTFTVSAHSPLSERVGLGFNVTRDEIFIAQESYIDANFSYNIKTSENGKLAFGLKAGIHLLDIDSNRAITGPFDPTSEDPVADINVDNRLSPQIGAGLFYYTDRFYMGLSVPNILETEHFDDSNNSNSSSTATERANWYLLTGYIWDLSQDVKFKPTLMTKLVSGAPLQVDVSANFLLYDKLTLGAAYRWSAALSGMVGFQFSDQIFIGFGYDQETTELQQFNDGSFEVILRWELFSRKNRLLSPRFF